MTNTPDLIKAVKFAIAGNWHDSHQIAQDYSDPMANWIHAVLHKIEGDVWNSQYWYKRTASKTYEDYADAIQELIAILHSLEQTGGE